VVQDSGMFEIRRAIRFSGDGPGPVQASRSREFRIRGGIAETVPRATEPRVIRGGSF